MAGQPVEDDGVPLNEDSPLTVSMTLGVHVATTDTSIPTEEVVAAFRDFLDGAVFGKREWSDAVQVYEVDEPVHLFSSRKDGKE